MRFTLSTLTAALFLLLGLAPVKALAQSFNIVPSNINVVVAPEFNHANVAVPITGTANGFNFGGLAASSDASWVTPSIDTSAHNVVLVFSTAALVNSSNTATITVSGNGTTDFFTVKATVAPLNVIKLVDDPFRSRTYGIHQDGLNAGAVVVIDPITNTKINCLTVGKKPTDLAVARDGSELLAINSVDQTITAIDLNTLQVRETMTLPTYVNWGASDTSADVAYGAGNIIYYTDGSWAPVLYVYNRATKMVLQQLTDNTNGIGDFAISPDGASFYAWVQYGWTAGWAASYLTRYSVNADGTLTFVERTAANYPSGLMRDPLDTPVLIDTAGAHVFTKQVAVNPAALADTYRSFPSPIYSISPGGEVAVTNSAIIEVATSLQLFTLPVATDVQTITSDYARLVYFDPVTRKLSTLDLIDAIGSKVLKRNLSPADGAVTLAPAKLEWSALPGVDSYRIYLGTSEAAVQNAGPQDAAFLATVNTPSYTLTTALVPGTTYYWRIDAVTTAGVAIGDVYRFTVSTIGSDLSSIDAATVRGHSAYQIDVQLSSAASVAWTVNADQPWVGFVATTGTSPGTLSVVLNASQLAAGIHTATITVQTAGAQTAFTLPVTLQVDPLAITVMAADPASAAVYALSEQAPPAGSASRAYLLELDSAAKTIKRVVRAGSSATDLAVHNGDNRIYVANWLLGQLLAIDKGTFQQVRGYGFAPFQSVGGPGGDVYRVAAGGPGRLLVEEEDQWINLSIIDTATGNVVGTHFDREGGGKYSPDHRYYYHGDDNISDAEIHKYDLIGDQFNQTAHTRIESVDYYGSRTVVVSENGERVFWNGAVMGKDLAVEWMIGDEIFSTSADGRLAFSATTIYDVDLRQAVLTMPATTRVSAYNSVTSRLVVQVGTEVKFFTIGDTTLDAPVLSLQGVATHSVDLAWTEASLPLGFTLQQRLQGDSDWQDVSSTISANATSFTATGLAASQAYEFRLKANSLSQSSAWSNIIAATTTTPVLPTAVTLAATNITASGAVLNGTANPGGSSASAYFEFGLTTDYGNTTGYHGLGNGTLALPVGQSLALQNPGATYHFRMVVINTDGTSLGDDQSFTLLPARPTVSINGIGNLTDSSVTLYGTINPNGTTTAGYFEYGTTLSLGQSTPSVTVGSGSALTSLTQSLAGLTTNTVYYYRLVATNAGGTNTTFTFSFKTGPDGGSGTTLTAVDDLAFTARREPRVIDVMANDLGAPRAELQLLSVAIPSAGSAVPYDDGTITYTPGSAFKGFDSFTYTIGDHAGNTASATVVIQDTYQNAAGVYNALVGATDAGFHQSGVIAVRVSRTGALTGNLTFGGVRYPLLAALRYDGLVSIEIKKNQAPFLTVSLQFDPATQQLSGGVLGPKGLAVLNAIRAPYTPLNPAPQAGRYTLLLLPDEASSSPEGYGYATMKVNADGHVKIDGRTAAGDQFASVASLGADGRFPLYSVAKPVRRISLHGWVQFRTVTATSDCDGTIGSSERVSGLLGQNALIGSHYVAPASGGMVLPFASTPDNASLEFWQASLNLASLPMTLLPTRLISETGQIGPVPVNARTGSFAGTFPMTGKRARFYGVVFQRQKLGAGVVMTKQGACAVLLRESSASSLGESIGPAHRFDHSKP